MSRILVVDDDRGIRDLYRLELESEGYEVLEAGDRAGALGTLKKSNVNLVVLDIRLEGESGLELLHTISNDYPKVPVIISSAYACYKSDFSSWLAEGYVVKSTDIDDLKSEISRVLEETSQRSGSRMP
ncbi:MAG: response regulator [bacterium]|nr:MAG: response regulator [bacterium]